MKIPVPKLKAMIRYFATYTDPRLLGKTKLMKLFYFSDFGHIKNFASPITYDRYVHLEHGPVPSTILNLVSAVENDPDNAILADAISVEEKDKQKRIVSIRRFSDKDEKYFTEEELQIMKMVCERFASKNAKFIEDSSHKESAWRMTREPEDISYVLATHDPDCAVEKEDIELSMEVLGS
jgi:uncharacterized phage-associated protein